MGGEDLAPFPVELAWKGPGPAIQNYNLLKEAPQSIRGLKAKPPAAEDHRALSPFGPSSDALSVRCGAQGENSGKIRAQSQKERV